jgi:hypothetical protein
MNVAKKIKLNELKQLDIISALRGRDVFVKDPSDEEDDIAEVDASKKPNFFDIIKDIRRHKQGDLLNNKEYEDLFNSFMVLRTLSMKEADVLLCNEVNLFTSMLTKEQLYKLLVAIIPRDSSFYPWIGNKKEDNQQEIEFISKYFECSEKEALEYVSILGTEWADQVKKKYGDLI